MGLICVASWRLDMMFRPQTWNVDEFRPGLPGPQIKIRMVCWILTAIGFITGLRS